MSKQKVYKDNVGDVFLIPEDYEEFISTLDNLITDTTRHTKFHFLLVEAWEEIMKEYRQKV